MIPVIEKGVINRELLKRKTLQWAQQFKQICFLDHNDYTNYPGQLTEGYLACGATSIISISSQEQKALDKLQHWLDMEQDWAFGYLSYELKNQIEELSSNHPSTVAFPLLSFFIPEYIFEFRKDEIIIIKSSKDSNKLWEEINKEVLVPNFYPNTIPSLETKFTKKEYLNTVEKLQQHIQLGDIYEVNFCQEYYCKNAEINPWSLFEKLNTNSRAPFASFLRTEDKFVLCSSPERFLQKKGSRLTSQPIKGTRPRGENDHLDALLKEGLAKAAKDKAEHVMIVDLVRNDLGKLCTPGSVEVSELFGIYSFEHVHQMISTINGAVLPEKKFKDIIQGTFPMGSMTGAPKVSALKIIEQYERSARGLYSGSVGYIKPDGDFDFNVVIRAMLYDQSEKLLSFQVGGAIVADSIPEEEYEECRVKSTGILQALFG